MTLEELQIIKEAASKVVKLEERKEIARKLYEHWNPDNIQFLNECEGYEYLKIEECLVKKIKDMIWSDICEKLRTAQEEFEKL